MGFTEGNDDKPKYEIKNVKVDVKDLAKALLNPFDLAVRGFDKKEFADWMADDRRLYREYGIDE